MTRHKCQFICTLFLGKTPCLRIPLRGQNIPEQASWFLQCLGLALSICRIHNQPANLDFSVTIKQDRNMLSNLAPI